MRRSDVLKSLAALALWPLAASCAQTPTGDDGDGPAYGARGDVMRFADDAAQRLGLERDWTRAALAAARFEPTVVRLIMPPPGTTAKNWTAYRSRFVEPGRIRAGLAFWNEHEALLREAEQRFGVPPAIVVGIVGVETIYGQRTGSFRVIDALATLSFDFPAGRSDRSAFFRGELENFLAWCHRESLDPLAPLGSYAGAIGWPQFMPSSILKYGIDFDADGHVDLHGSPADVIGSVANYLAAFGWQRGMPTHFAVVPPESLRDRALLLAPDIVPTFTVAEFAERGAQLDARGRDFDGKLALVMLQNGDEPPSYVAGTANFYAITRYNWSSYYALAVIELGEAVARLR